VKSYDAATQTAEVVPVVRSAAPNLDGSTTPEDLPVIPNVPVAWPRAGGYYLHFPLTVGDHVLLVFSEAAIAQWRGSGETSDPGDLSRHDLSYPFAIPGIAPDAQAFADAPESEAVIGVGSGGSLRVSESAMGGLAQSVVVADGLDAVVGIAATAAIAAGVAGDGGKAAFKAFSSTFSAGVAGFASLQLKAQAPPVPTP